MDTGNHGVAARSSRPGDQGLGRNDRTHRHAFGRGSVAFGAGAVLVLGMVGCNLQREVEREGQTVSRATAALLTTSRLQSAASGKTSSSKTSSNKTSSSKTSSSEAARVTVAATKAVRVVKLPVRLDLGRTPEAPSQPTSQPTAVFSCVAGAEEDTMPEWIAPVAGSSLSAGTQLRWDRTGHDICGGFGSNKRYSIAICAAAPPSDLDSTNSPCLPNNGFYIANISPENLGWQPADLGEYTLSVDDITQIIEKAGGNLPDGSTIHAYLRYNYDNFNTRYGDWTSRPFSLNSGPANVPPAPVVAPTLSLPETYGESAPIDANWNPVGGATHYQVQLAYRAGHPEQCNWTHCGLGTSETWEVTSPAAESDAPLPPQTIMVVWKVKACNAGGCGPSAIQGVFLPERVSADNAVSFDVIKAAFRAPACVNCHQAAAPDGNWAALTTAHTGTVASVRDPQACQSCHTNALLPATSHLVPWQAPPVGDGANGENMDFRGLSDSELCEKAKDPGTVAENVADHLLEDPLIIWAVEGGALPFGAGNTTAAYPGATPAERRAAWTQAVMGWINGGMSCD